MSMRPIRIGSAMRIEIGYDGENGAREIVFDATKWMQEMPGCTAAITAERADGEKYIAPNVTQDEEKRTITWTLTSAETMEGEGRAQLLWMDGERTAKQAIFTTVCHESLKSDATEIGVPEPVWAQKSVEAAKEAKESAQAAAASAEGAQNALEETKNVRDTAKQEIDGKKENAIAGIENAKTEAIVAIQAEKEELAPPIISTAEGVDSVAADSADRTLRGLTVYGKTTQDGTPGEDAPVVLESVGDAGNVEMTVARGLPDTIVIIKQPRHLAGAVGDTAIFEVIALGYGLTYQWQWKGSGTNSEWSNTGLSGNKTASLIVPVTESRNGNRYRCVIKDANGHTVTTKDASLTVGDVAESDDAADDTQTATISTEEGLRGVPVMSGTGTYTDADGQGWIADTIEYDAKTGTAQIVRRVASVTYDGSADEDWGVTYGYNALCVSIANAARISHGLCTHFEGMDIANNQNAIGFSAATSDGLIAFRPNDYAHLMLDIDAWRAQLNASPVTVLYALAVPEMTPITGDELAALTAMRSRYPETTVFNNAGAQMAVRYIADTKTYVDDANTELAKAILTVDGRVDTAMEQTENVGETANAAKKKADENEIKIGEIKNSLDDTNKKALLTETENLFNPSDVVKGAFVNSKFNAEFSTKAKADFSYIVLEVEPNTNYTISNSDYYITSFNSSNISDHNWGDPITGDTNITITTLSTTKKITVSFRHDEHPASKMMIVKGDALPGSYVPYGYKLTDTADKFINGMIYHVGTGCDYTSFTDCIKALKGDETRKTIYVHGGTYDIFEEMGGAEYTATLTGDEDWKEVNNFVPPNTHIIGVGDVIFKFLPTTEQITDAVARLLSPVNIAGSCTIENITINAQNCRYCIHDETSGHTEYTGAIKRYKNVRCYKGGSLGMGQAYASGFDSDMQFDFQNCVFKSNRDAFSMHNRSATLEHSSRITINSCVFDCGDGRIAVRFGSVNWTKEHIKTDIYNSYIKGNVLLADEYESSNLINGFDIMLVGCGSTTVDVTATSNDYEPTVYAIN